MDYTKVLIFEWDEAKSNRCLKERGFDFHYVVQVFADLDAVVRMDNRRDYGEERFEVVGRVCSRVFTVVYTHRANAIRVISARRANHREVKRYESSSYQD